VRTIGPTAPRPRIFKLATTDVERAADDPGLAALAREGWTVAASFQAAEMKGDAEIRVVVLVLWPPAERSPQAGGWDPRLLGLAVALSWAAIAVLGVLEWAS
jgi:hypothetical protein